MLLSAIICRNINDYSDVFKEKSGGKFGLKFRDNNKTNSKRFKKPRKEKPQHKKW